MALYASCPIINGNLSIFIDFFMEIKTRSIFDVVNIRYAVRERKMFNETIISYLLAKLAMNYGDIYPEILI